MMASSMATGRSGPARSLRGKLVCAACGQVITAARLRLRIQGQHRHHLRNPAGITYVVGCFREAIGCVVEGPDSREASWFSGYAWRRAFCAGCRAHLGWSFRGPAVAPFFALILVGLRDATAVAPGKSAGDR